MTISKILVDLKDMPHASQEQISWDAECVCFIPCWFHCYCSEPDIQVTLTTDDNAVLQAGGECIRSYLAVTPDQVSTLHPFPDINYLVPSMVFSFQVVAFTDPQGKSGILHVIAVAEHLLNPVGSEFSATFVGRLVTTLIQQMGPRLGEHLDLLLKAVLSKLQVCFVFSLQCNLILCFKFDPTLLVLIVSCFFINIVILTVLF